MSLRSKVVRGLTWRTCVSASQHLLQIGFTIVLARLLTRADFGLVAMALLTTRLLATLTQAGFGTAILQSRQVTDGQVTALFCVQVTVNTLVAIACWAAAPWAAAFFETPAVEPVIRVVAWTLPLHGLSFPQVLLRKELKFGAYSVLELTALLLGNIGGVILAAAGYGVWALVVRLLVVRGVFGVGIWFVAGWIPARPVFRGVGGLVRFGFHMLGSNVCHYASQNVAAILTGKLIGVETLGSFNIAFNLAVVPAQKIQQILTTVLAPAFCAIHENLRDLKRKVSSALFNLGLLYIPLMFGLGAVARNLVVAFYGEKWREAGLFLTFLAGVGLTKGLEHVLRSVILARGRSASILRVTVAETLASLPLIGAGAWLFGVYGLIAGYLLASVFALFLTVRAAHAALEGEAVFGQAVARSFAAGGFMCLVVLLYGFWSTAAPFATVGTQVALGLVVYAALRILTLTPDERELLRAWPLVRRLVPSR